MTEEMIKQIAEDLVTIGYNNTMSGNYHIDFDEVAEMYGIPVETIIENKNAIAEEIDKSDLILSETWVDEDFDMNFCFDESDFED